MDSKTNIKEDYSETEKSPAGTIIVSEGTVHGGFHAWAKNISLEEGGIQRVTDEERQTNTTKVWNACTFWYFTSIRPEKLELTEFRLSANMAVATLSTGTYNLVYTEKTY